MNNEFTIKVLEVISEILEQMESNPPNGEQSFSKGYSLAMFDAGLIVNEAIKELK
jgi:hypothetical protein